MDSKTCTKCGSVKPKTLEFFVAKYIKLPDGSRRTKPTQPCRACACEAAKLRNAKRSADEKRESARKSAAARRAKHGRGDRSAEYAKRKAKRAENKTTAIKRLVAAIRKAAKSKKANTKHLVCWLWNKPGLTVAEKFKTRYALDPVYRERERRKSQHRKMEKAQERGEGWVCWLWESPLLSKEDAYTMRRQLDPKFDMRIRKQTARTALREKRIRRATPAWFDEWHSFVWHEARHVRVLREQATGIRWDLDHMIPLRARGVSGLHVAENWQIIPGSMNCKKSRSMQYTKPLEWLRHL